MSDDPQRPIVVKKIKKAAHGHHGGAWKIAYADFVTAMMAFFLLMWLLGSTTKGDLQGIAEYFKTPLKVALQGGSGSGDSASVIKTGGGNDMTKKEGQRKRTDDEGKNKKLNTKEAEKELLRMERVRLGEIKKRLDLAIEANPTLNQFKKQLLIDVTTEGLRIQLVDEKNRPMFAIGSTQLQPYTKEIIRQIGLVLNDIPNRITISGHTDATAYSGGERGYSNWELSADRANTARRELLAGGMQESRIARVIGLASSVLLDVTDAFNPENRRVSIIVMNKKAEDAALKDGGTVESAAELQEVMGQEAPAAEAPVSTPPADQPATADHGK
jgi:chemotaxis protein MotB